MAEKLDIFLICVPGLEPHLASEAAELGFSPARAVAGGVELRGTWQDVWRANLWLRGATRVLVRMGSFRALNLNQLGSEAQRFPWADTLIPREPVRIDVTCRKSRISHAGAATQRLERALRSAAIPVHPQAQVTLKIRIEKDICTLSVDTSGEPLHKRGHKAAVSKAPLRETMASLMLRACGYEPGESVIDPMCGSGTFPIEAAEIAANLAPGRSRSFAFERLASFNAASWAQMRPGAAPAAQGAFYGFDRDAGAIRAASDNAKRAGVSCQFDERPVAALAAPEGTPGLVICNPPYGARIGNKKSLFALYGTLGARLREPGFAGWRAGILTSDIDLAKSTGLNFEP
ncbi:MAG: class I SAM-dependent RNA methyltransferase, partial [Pseudomonadota bacterium]